MTHPTFYEPDRVGRFALARTGLAVAAGLAARLPPAASDERRVLLLLVDVQVDFVHADGALSVPGAVDDTRRTIAWLFDHEAEIGHIAASLDSHVPLQIFFPTWWADSEGRPPEPYTAITAQQVKAGRWQPLYEPDWSLDYVKQLQSQAKKDLMIWPFHTLLGTPGHSLTPALYEAVAYHAAARGYQPTIVTKGLIAKTEYYSLLEPEVKVPGVPGGELNRSFLQQLASFDLIYVAGQAKSHCVLETVQSILRHAPDLAPRLRLLEDACSPVSHPDIDFARLADEAFSRFAAQGVGRVTTRDPIG